MIDWGWPPGWCCWRSSLLMPAGPCCGGWRRASLHAAPPAARLPAPEQPLGFPSAVDLLVGWIFCGWLLPLAWLAEVHPNYGFLLVILAYLPLLLGMAKVRPVRVKLSPRALQLSFTGCAHDSNQGYPGGSLLNRVGRYTSRSIAGLAGKLRDGLENDPATPQYQTGLFAGLDMVFVGSMPWLAVAVATATPISSSAGRYACAAVTVVLSAIVFLRLGLYRAVIRFMGQQAIWAVLTAVSYSTMILGATVFSARRACRVPCRSSTSPWRCWDRRYPPVGARAYYQASCAPVGKT